MPIAKESGGKRFEPAPEGTFVARCYRVLDLGTQEKLWMGQTKQIPQVFFAFELPTETQPPLEDGADTERVFSITAVYTNSLHPKAALRRDLESWRGRKFTEEELQGFELANLLGKACMLSIVHNESKGKTYANIKSISGLPKGTECLPPFNEPVLLDLAPGKYDRLVFDSLSEGMKVWIGKSPEWRELQKDTNPSGGSAFDGDVPF